MNLVQTSHYVLSLNERNVYFEVRVIEEMEK